MEVKHTKIATDQMGNEIKFNYPPKRIISLVPSQTELLYDLGLDHQVVGITKFCERPSNWLKTKTIVGGTKKLRHNVIDNLRPDLIIGNKEENDKKSISLLQKKYPVWMSDIITLKDALCMIQMLGEITASTDKSKIISSEITEAFNNIMKRQGSVLYLIWRKPWMGVGSDTFIHSMLNEIGFTNVLEKHIRYPELTDELIRSIDPEYILLSSEPYPFEKKHIEELKEIFPEARVMLVDGQYFSWYGSRLREAPGYFSTLNIWN